MGVAPSKPPTAALPVPIKSKKDLAVKQALSGYALAGKPIPGQTRLPTAAGPYALGEEPDPGMIPPLLGTKPGKWAPPEPVLASTMSFKLKPPTTAPVPSGDLTRAEMDAAKPILPGSITGMGFDIPRIEIASAGPFKALTSKPGPSKKIDLTPPSPVAKVAAALPAPPAAPADIYSAEIGELPPYVSPDERAPSLPVARPEPPVAAVPSAEEPEIETILAPADIYSQEPGGLSFDDYDANLQKVFEESMKNPNKVEAFTGSQAPFAPLTKFLGQVEGGDYAQAAKSALEAVLPTDPVGLGLFGAGIALQLSAGGDIEDIAVNMAKKKVATHVAQQTTNYIAKEVVKSISDTALTTIPTAALGVPGAIVGIIAGKAATNQSITTESVMKSAGELGMSATLNAMAGGPLGTVVGLARMAQDIHDMKKSALKAKRKYEDQAFSAPITGLQPNLRNIEQSTGHPTRDIQNLFKDSWAGEKNYLGQQLAKELDPPDGARYYHGDESTRKMMENNLGIIQKYRNTVPAYDNVWNQYVRGQIGREEFKAQSQKAIDNHIVGKLGAKRSLKPGEVTISDTRFGRTGAAIEIVNINTESGRDAYFETTGRTPPGWSRELIDPDIDEYEWINIAERNKRWEAQGDPGQWG